MWRMECDESLQLMPELIDSLSLIVLGESEEDIVRGWEKLRDLEESGFLSGSGDLKDAQSITRGILRGSISNLHQVPKLMAYFAKYVKKKADGPGQDCDFVVNDYVAFVQMTAGEDIRLLASMVEVLRDHPVYRTTTSGNGRTSKSIESIVMSLGSFPMPKNAYDIPEFRCCVAEIQESLRTICKSSKDVDNSDLVIASLRTVYRMITDTERQRDPGPGLVAVLELVETKSIPQVVKLNMSESRSDEQLESALKFLCAWVPMWLRIENLSVWITEFIRSLENAKKYDILTRVANTSLRSFLRCTMLPMSRVHATYLSTVMLHSQASPDLFHKIIKENMFEKVFAELVKTKTEDATRCAQNLVDVTKALMERFPGYAIYEELVKSFPVQPLARNVQTFRNERRRVRRLRDDHEISTTHVEPQCSTVVDHGKVGLTNLGNTCYMNSVLQALAMTRQFTQEVMRHGSSGTSEERGESAWVASAEEAAAIMPKLQNLFALLTYSKRRSLSPTEILAASRPEYFTPGQQQDSSEFLCHLLDVLYEQEKSMIRRRAVVAETSAGPSGKGKRSSDVISPDRGVIKRWTTEEDLSEGISLERKTSQSLGDFPQATEDEEQLGQTQPGELLSDCHSDSTDSGIQSVDGGGTSAVGIDESTVAQSILVHRVFGGESKITYQCAQCDTSSHNTDRFRDLQLCFPQEIADNQEVSVQDLMNYYLTPEKLTGENKYRCDKCAKLCDAQRMIKILRAPIHLILTLKHFHYDPETRLRTKLRHKVIYNETIQLPVSSCTASTASSPVPETYRLYAAVVHSGYSMDYGHYTTYARDSKNNWYKFNDSYVSHTGIEDFNGLEPPDTPYILFYEKIQAKDGTINREDSDEESTKTALSTLSKHIQDLVERDARAYDDEIGHRGDKKRSQRISPSDRIIGPSLRRHDNSDDENPPPSSCRGHIGIQANRFCF